MPTEYDFCFAWNWPYDHTFVSKVEQACQMQDVSLLQVTPDNLHITLEAVAARQISFSALFDRASDCDECFLDLGRWARLQGAIHINQAHRARRAWDKVAMHLSFANAGLPTPLTYILPAYTLMSRIPAINLACLGDHFVIKPAHGGGGDGVITGATSWDQVQAARQMYPDDQYLLQTHVTPAVLEDQPAWFRVIYCAGSIFPCWWNPFTHLYTPLTYDQIERLQLAPLLVLPDGIARVCQLELFSTEIAYTSSGQFLIVDYVNDPIDLRPQSLAPEGVPDHLIEQVANELTAFVARRKREARLYSLAVSSY